MGGGQAIIRAVLGWAELGWAGLGWAGLGCAGLGWAGLGSTNCIRTGTAKCKSHHLPPAYAGYLVEGQGVLLASPVTTDVLDKDKSRTVCQVKLAVCLMLQPSQSSTVVNMFQQQSLPLLAMRCVHSHNSV